MTASWTESIAPRLGLVWEECLRHPFLQELAEGTLSRERFGYYLRQDYVYLQAYMEALKAAIRKAPDPERAERFQDMLRVTADVEMEGHRRLAAKFGISRGELERTVPAKTTEVYIRYMLSGAEEGGFANTVAAILPCAWSYTEIGRTLAKRGAARQHPEYGAWITAYASDKFAELTNWLRSLLDNEVRSLQQAELERLESQILEGARMEIAFWDMAYRMEE